MGAQGISWTTWLGAIGFQGCKRWKHCWWHCRCHVLEYRPTKRIQMIDSKSDGLQYRPIKTTKNTLPPSQRPGHSFRRSATRIHRVALGDWARSLSQWKYTGTCYKGIKQSYDDVWLKPLGYQILLRSLGDPASQKKPASGKFGFMVKRFLSPSCIEPFSQRVWQHTWFNLTTALDPKKPVFSTLGCQNWFLHPLC